MLSRDCRASNRFPEDDERLRPPGVVLRLLEVRDPEGHLKPPLCGRAEVGRDVPEQAKRVRLAPLVSRLSEDAPRCLGLLPCFVETPLVWRSASARQYAYSAAARPVTLPSRSSRSRSVAACRARAAMTPR